MPHPRFINAAEPIARRDLRGDSVRDALSPVLPALAIVGVVVAFWMIWQAFITPYPTPAPISPMQTAKDFSVTPIWSTSGASPAPIQVIVMTPAPTPTPAPILWQTATAEARLTATATRKPQPCPETQEGLAQLPPGTLCRQPTETPIPAPTSSPLSGCDPTNWLPGEICEIGAPFAPTPSATAGAVNES